MKPLSFMENENEQIQEEEELDLPEVAEGEEDTTDWKELALKQQGINKRLKTKVEKLKEKPPEPKEPEKPVKKEEKQSSDFDYGQKAFLKSYGIDGADERELVKSFQDRTGDDLDSIVADDIFMAKLDKLREAKAVKEAVPAGGRRSVSTDVASDDYWLSKYETGTPLNDVPLEHRNKVLNAHLKKQEERSMFGKTSLG